jgi:LacI family transcriptional regulator
LNRFAIVLTTGTSFYRDVMRGVMAYVNDHGGIEIITINPELVDAGVHDFERNMGLIASVNQPVVSQFVDRWKHPIVNVSTILPGLNCDTVQIDNEATGLVAWQHLRSLGLGHFAFIGKSGMLVSDEREHGFVQAATADGFSVEVFHDPDDRPFDPYYHTWPLGDSARQWIIDLPEPVGIFTPNDVWGTCVLKACQLISIRVPEDVAVLGVDNDDLFCESSSPTLSSIEVPGLQVGWHAAERLMELMGSSMERNRNRQIIRLQPQRLVVRKSTSGLFGIDPEVIVAAQYIRDNAHRGLSVSEVVSHCGLSRRSTERRFLSSFGTSVGEAIRVQQMEIAKNLLRTTDLPVKVVAFRSGFENTRHLATVFRVRMNQTPSEFRNNSKPSN